MGRDETTESGGQVTRPTSPNVLRLAQLTSYFVFINNMWHRADLLFTVVHRGRQRAEVQPIKEKTGPRLRDREQVATRSRPRPLRQ